MTFATHPYISFIPGQQCACKVSSPSHASKGPSKVGNENNRFCSSDNARPEQAGIGDNLDFTRADDKAVGQECQVERQLAEHYAAVQQ